MSYALLFAVAFAAATLLPLSSEAALYYDLRSGGDPWLLLLAAGSGNTLGSFLNYFIGRKGVDWLLAQKKISTRGLARSEAFFDRWGGWSLWLSWVPIVGDPLTFVAGAMHYDWRKFLLIVSLAKFGRYAVILLGQ
ncbi:VTT domain-containing protein [Nitratifractor sp.]|uniref:YqaA family protein n=1 Tax=Nitratifractor sp. TaxID=2268144 RepID=UPI0025F50D77|nr:VTT domain-containing protein [Nitratifractor sp.]